MRVGNGRGSLAVGALLATGLLAGLAWAENPPTTLGTLLDRAQIQDLLVDYYAKLGTGGGDFGAFYVSDGVLDVNGLVAEGKKPIEDLYQKIARGTPHRQGTFRMLLTNEKIVVDGETAVADVMWTGINSSTIAATPQFVEQGREHDDLVKRDGRWYFKHRTITSDGGLPLMFEQYYKSR